MVGCTVGRRVISEEITRESFDDWGSRGMIIEVLDTIRERMMEGEGRFLIDRLWAKGMGRRGQGVGIDAFQRLNFSLSCRYISSSVEYLFC